LTARSSAIPEFLGRPALTPVKLSGHEGLNQLFEYQLVMKTPDGLNYIPSKAANFKLNDFIGQELTVLIEIEGRGTGLISGGIGAGVREITGLITEARFLGEDGREALYRLTLRPWLHLATLTSDCKIFQDMTVVNILDAVLADYNFPVEKRLIDSYPIRDYQTQWLETDFQFISRLCEEYGISYHFEHSEGSHRLVLSDSMAAYRPNPSSAYAEVSFYPPNHKIDEEYIHAFVPGNALTSGAYATTEYDYTRPRASLARGRKQPRPTGQSGQEIFDFHASSHYTQPMAGPQQAVNDPFGEGDKLALLRMQALRAPGTFGQGSGHLRGMVPGYTFTLVKHPHDSANVDYVILSTRLLIEEIGDESQRPRKVSDGLRGLRYLVEVDFDVFPTYGEQYRPAQRAPKPFTHGPQTALVVGPENQNVWTDALGRIKVQFPWDRYGKTDQNSSCWVRVSSPWAGNQLGATHVPRVGQEVVIDWLGGDPDLPICTGRVHNQVNLPSWKLPDQHAISGFRSRELMPNGGNASGGRSNHLVLDDTEAKIQAQLRSDHDASQLSLGHITRIESNIGRQDYRGHGFELRTDGHGAVRARSGLLVTTEARNGASAHVLDIGETVQRLTVAREQHESLSDTAQEAGAHDMKQDQSEVTAVLKDQNDQIKGQPGGGSGGGEGDNFPEFVTPHLVLASPVGIETTTAGSTHLASAAHTAITSGRHTSLSSGGNLLASVKGAIRLFAYKTGIKLISAQADIDIQALKQSIRLLAKLEITQTANRITISAKEELLLNGGGSYTCWKAGNIEHGTMGAIVSYAATTSHPGPKNKPLPVLPVPPVRKDNLTVALASFPQQGHAFANEPYEVYKSGALFASGVTDEHGLVQIPDHKAGTPGYTIKLSSGAEFNTKVTPQLNAANPDHRLGNAGFRAIDGPESRDSDYPSTT